MVAPELLGSTLTLASRNEAACPLGITEAWDGDLQTRDPTFTSATAMRCGWSAVNTCRCWPAQLGEYHYNRKAGWGPDSWSLGPNPHQVAQS